MMVRNFPAAQGLIPLGGTTNDSNDHNDDGRVGMMMMGEQAGRHSCTAEEIKWLEDSTRVHCDIVKWHLLCRNVDHLVRGGGVRDRKK